MIVNTTENSGKTIVVNLRTRICGEYRKIILQEKG